MRCRGVSTLLPALALWSSACGGTTGSVGAVLGRDEETHAVHLRDVPKGLGAAEAGLVPGDEIVMIDGFYVRDLSARQIRTLLRGDVGTQIELTVVRNGEVRRVRVTRTALRVHEEQKERRLEE